MSEEKLEGKVKFFNYDRGYGFIKVGEEDYFVHVTNIEDSDLLLSDEKVEFKPVKGHKGLQAIEVERLNAPNMKKEEGFIEEFHEEKGFGFIGREGKADVFVHLTDITNIPEIEMIHEGDEVKFDVKKGRDGRDRAYRVVFQKKEEEEEDEK